MEKETSEELSRSELVFLYDARDLNPNGDPLDENRPRMDPEEDINIVTDSRLKRTIRDYLDSQGEKIFIKELKREDGTLKSRARLLSEYLTKNHKKFPNWEIESLEEIKEKSDTELWNLLAEVSAKKLKDALLETFLDLRLFGATIAVKKKTITQIGPVQFKLGRSLHEVEPQLIKGTTVMPSRAGVEAGTITETWVLPYSLIGFYGIINENTGKETGLTEKDINFLMEGLWNGTKDLITRSKVGQLPRLLVRVVYNEGNYHIGDLDKKIKMEKTVDKRDKEIREISELKIDITDLLSLLNEEKEKINRIELRAHRDANFLISKEETVSGKQLKEKIKEHLEDIPCQEITFPNEK